MSRQQVSSKGGLGVDLKSYLAGLPSQAHARGTAFEDSLIEVLTTHPDFKFEKIQRYSSWEHGGHDIGIDLVALDKDGLWWAIQAKCFDPERTIPKSEIDSFLAASQGVIRNWGRSFDRRLLIGTAGFLSDNARIVLKQSQPEVVVQLHDELDAADLDWIGKGNTPHKYSEIQLRDYQEQAVKEVTTKFETADKGQLIMACGTGKTITALAIAKNLSAKKILILTPSLQLLRQTKQSWQKSGDLNGRNWLVVCSDETAGDDFDSDQTEVLDLGFSVTTSPQEIASFLKANDSFVIFSTYQSSENLSLGCQSWGKEFDLVIADECHRTVGSLDSNFGLVLDNQRISSKKKLFMTATPRTISPKLRLAASEHEVEVSSMDDPEVYGEVLFEYSFAQAIADGHLAKYEIVVAAMDKKSVGDLINQRGNVPFAAEVIVLKSLKDFSVSSAISYHSRLSSAEKFSKSMKEVNELMPVGYKAQLGTGYVNGQMRTRQKSNLLKKLQEVEAGETYLLTNARCLTEGIDVPNLDAVCFVDPRTSMVDIVQAVGRVLRKGSNPNKVGKIIIPILVDDLSDPDLEFSQTKFAGLWKVICALESHDESLRDEMQNLRLGLSNSSRSSVMLPEGLRITVPANVTNIGNFVNAISLKIVERVTSDWELGYSHLKAHAEITGDPNPPSAAKDQFNYPVGLWCSTQRAARRGQNRGLLTRERIQKLDAIGFIWDPLEAGWTRGYEALKKYTAEFGHSNVPSGTLYPDGFKLGQWVQMQRLALKQEILAVKKQDLLLEIGFDFERKNTQRQELVTRLQKYYDEFGTVNVPTKYVSQDGNKLGLALDRIRQLKKNSPESDHEAIVFLESKDIIWNVKDVLEEDSFRKGLTELDLHLEKFSLGDLKQSSISESGFRIGAWIERMRAKKTKGNLSSEHENFLKARGIELELMRVQYLARIEVLEEFFKKHGHIRVPRELKPKGLGSIHSWLKDQKKRRREGSLSSEEIETLDRFGYVWENESDLIKKQSWNRFVEGIIAFKESTGTFNVPSEFRTESNYALGALVSKYRTMYRKNELSEDKVKELDAIAFEWDVPRPNKFSTPRVKLPIESKQNIKRRNETQWDKFLKSLKLYKQANGDLLIPAQYRDASNFMLGQTAVDYRSAFRRGELIQEKIDILNELGFLWEVGKPSNAQFAWENFLDELKKYKETFGNLDIPNTYVSPSSFSLGIKARYTRTLNNNGELENWKYEQLSILGFPWGRKR
jgi:superfamily II DNA or RNA helicase